MLKCKWCEAEIKEKNWNYCMKCGSSSGFLKDFPREGIKLPIVIEDSASVYCARCPFLDSKTSNTRENNNSWKIELVNSGYKSVKVKVSLKNEPEWLKLKNKSGKPVQLINNYPLMLSVTGKINDEFKKEFFLELESNDEYRDVDNYEENRWRKEIWRTQKIPVNFEEQGIGKLSIKENILIFNRNILERKFLLKNTGEKCTKLINVSFPEGFELFDSQGRSLNMATVSNFYLTCEQEDLLTLKINNRKKAYESKRENGDLKLSLKTCNDDMHELLIYIEEEEKIDLIPPRYVVGIDFGTENTSVYYLDVIEDKIESIKIGGDTSIPSYMYFYHDRPYDPPAFGITAKNEASTRREEEGDLIKDIKLLLGRDNDSYISRYMNSKYTNEYLLVEFLTFLKREIDLFISQKNSARVKVKYVFTLPVLDNGELYKEQKEKMKKAIKDVFSNKIDIEKDVKFIKEPQAAALYFFSPETLSSLELPPFENNDTICIYDSGGGTTDIALLRINTGDGGKDSFEVLGTLGTRMPGENEFEDEEEIIRFAGRIVDETVLDLIVKNSTGSSNPTEEQINIQRELLFNEVCEEAGMGPYGIWNNIELCKWLLDKEETVKLNEKIKSAPNYLTDEFSASRVELQKTLAPLIDETMIMIKKLKELNNIEKIKYIFPIGGNSRFPLVEENLKTILRGSQVVDLKSNTEEKIRMEAVARGSVLAYKAIFSNLIPYDIYWAVTGDNIEDWQQIFYENNSLPHREEGISINVSSGDRIEILLAIGIKDNKYSIGSFPIEVYEGIGYRKDQLFFGISKDWTFYVYHNIGGTNRREKPFSYKFK